MYSAKKIKFEKYAQGLGMRKMGLNIDVDEFCDCIKVINHDCDYSYNCVTVFVVMNVM